MERLCSKRATPKAFSQALELGWPLAEAKKAPGNLLRGRACLLRQQAPEALRLFEGAVRIDPTLKDGFFWGGVAAAEAGVASKAGSLFAQGCGMGAWPDFGSSATAWQALGRYFLDRGDFLQAQAVLTKATRIDPGQPSLLVSLGEAWAEGGKVEEAMTAFRQALVIHPLVDCAGKPRSLFRFGSALSGANQHDRARKAFSRAIPGLPTIEFPADRESLMDIGHALVLLDRGKEAAEAFRRAAKGFEESGATGSFGFHCCLGIALALEGSAPEAVLAFERAAARGREFPSLRSFPFWTCLGTALRNVGDHQRALAAFQEAASLRPKEPEVLAECARACAWIGEPEAFRTWVDRLGALDEDRLAKLFKEVDQIVFLPPPASSTEPLPGAFPKKGTFHPPHPLVRRTDAG